MSEKEESPKRNNMKDYYTIDPSKQINFINNSLFELDTIEDKYDKANSTGSDTFNEKYSNIEYTKTLKISLKDSINQNDLLTEELMKVINENKMLKEELEEKNKAIEELSQYYHYCVENHLNSNCGKYKKNGSIQEIEERNVKKERRKRKRLKNIFNNNFRKTKRDKDELCEIMYIK